MKGEEARFWNLIRDNLSDDFILQRFESGNTGRGIPDVMLCPKEGNKISFLELKVVKELPKKDTTKMGIELHPTQERWLTRWGKRIDTTYVFVKLLEPKEFFLFHWGDIKGLHRITHTEAMFVAERVYKGRADWNNLKKLLED